MTFLEIYNVVKGHDASDIHLNVGFKPAIRKYGDIVYLDEFPEINEKECIKTVRGVGYKFEYTEEKK